MKMDRRGVVAVWVAVMATGLVTAMSLGLEAVNWSVAQVQTQRAADAAAMAGALNYKVTQSAQTAATFAARMAQLNGGGAGVATPGWNSATQTLTDGTIVAQVTAGVQNASNKALKVVIQKTVPVSIARLFSTLPSVTVTATSLAELVSTVSGGGGPQPCLVALSTSGSITGAGSTYLTMPNCSVVSNGTIDVHGGGNLNTGGIYARGAINIDAWIPAAGQHPNNGTIPDPYATHTALQNALTAAGTGSATNIVCQNQACSGLPAGTCTGSSSIVCNLNPGTYGGLAVTSGGPYRFNLAAGLYVFKGNMSFGGNTTTSGTDVTILTSGTFTGANTFNFSITAPTPSAASSTGGIAGVALAGRAGGTVSVSGSDNVGITGVVYFPNAVFDASGSSGLGSSGTTCMELIAASVRLSGYSYFNSSCASLGTTAFGSMPGTTVYTAALVQ